ncbi:MAG: hypothetical protein PHN69_02655 [Candidatus Pacebacteria bacterium]|nr:hypothetical protein [Candidatus Paceibacterota bacterium]
MPNVKKGTYSKVKFKTVLGNEPETSDTTKIPTKKATFDFSDEKPFISATLIQFFTFLLFIFGLGWFIASQWVFQTQVAGLKYEIKEDISGQLTEVKIKIDNLKILNPYLK